MKVIATTAMGKKLVALLDDNNQVIEGVMSVDYARFSGQNKDSKGGHGRLLFEGNWEEVPSGKFSNKLSDITNTSRVFSNISVTRSKSYKNIQVIGSIPEILPSNAVNVNYYPTINSWLYQLVTYTGWTAGNNLVEWDLKTLKEKTVEVFSVKDPDQRRKINISNYSFLVLNPF